MIRYPYKYSNYPSAILDVLSIKRTIVPSCWSFAVYILYSHFYAPILIEDKLIPMLSVSIALLLAFRTNRAFERYWYGAQQWTILTSQLRTLSRIIWNGIDAPTMEFQQEKLATMKLLYAVAVATKHVLRAENALEQSDLLSLLPLHMVASVRKTGKLGRDLVISYKSSLVHADEPEVPFTAQSASTKMPSPISTELESFIASTSSSVPVDQSLKKLKTQKSDGITSTLIDLSLETPYLRKQNLLNGIHPQQCRSFVDDHHTTLNANSRHSTSIRLPLTTASTSNAPFDLIHRISYYARRQRHLGHLDSEDSPSINKAIEITIDALTKFEQLLSIPVPKSYAVHIKQVLILYFLTLPFQLVKALGFNVVIVTIVTAFALFGADAIAAEVEDPFGLDQNDLPIDKFCNQLRDDIEYIMESPGFFVVNQNHSYKSETKKKK